MKTRFSVTDLLFIAAAVLFTNILFAVASPVVQAHAQEARILSSSAGGPMKADERTALTNGKVIAVVDYQGKIIRQEDFNP